MTAALEHVAMPQMGEPGAPGPFALADADRLRDILLQAGFDAPTVCLDKVDLPITVGQTAQEALAFFQQSDLSSRLLADASEDQLARVWESMLRSIEAHVTPHGATLGSAAWLVQARTPG